MMALAMVRGELGSYREHATGKSVGSLPRFCALNKPSDRPEHPRVLEIAV